MNNDSELLRRYVEKSSEPAFTELVQRHIGLVYSVALRRVGGDAHSAEDVAQKVFSDLARKAPSLTDRATLSGWLFASTHLASAAVVRSEQRRKARETEAHTMQTTLSPDEPDADWTRLRPVVDDVIAALKDEEREAIALRFFEQRSFAEVGASLRVSEEAARKRVDRALEKLRSLLARRGVTSSAAVLGVALTTIGTNSVPAGLGATTAQHALTHAGVTTSATITGTVLGALLPAAAVLVFGVFVNGAQQRSNGELRAELTQLATKNGRLAALRSENRKLAGDIAKIDDARRALAVSASPSLRSVVEPPLEPRPISARINVTEDGRIMWNRELVNLREFIARLQALPGTAAPESRVNIRAVGTSFSALAYVIDEVRKAQLDHVTVESNVTPDPKFGWSWF